MTSGRVHRPANLKAASDGELLAYLMRCWQWGDEKGAGEAEQELRRRGQGAEVENLKNRMGL
jgi:hypothetical protein